MKNTFNGWDNSEISDIDVISNLILTGRTAKEAKSDSWLFKYLGDSYKNIKVLDFGCGMGRNTFQLGISNPNWSVIGYDNAHMLSKTNEYHTIHYLNKIPLNIKFISDWDLIKIQKFDVIFCCLVLQHIHEETLSDYLFDFKNMTSKLIVTGRRFNDDTNKKSTWSLLEKSGLTPNIFLKGDNAINYQPEGNPEDHNTAIYIL